MGTSTAPAGARSRWRRLNGIDAAYLAGLRATTRTALASCFTSTTSEVVLLDAPTHRNFGDSLIWEGTRRYLAELGLRVAYTADLRGFRDEDLRKAPREAPLLFNGGGNFGDFWPEPEQFRRHIIESFPERRIILLPQSMHFRDPTERAASTSIYQRASNLTVLLRDTVSMNLAAEHFPSTDHRFCYDLAFGARPPLTPGRRTQGPLVLARVDQEAREVDREFASRQGTVDWRASKFNQWLWNRAIWAKNYYRFAPLGVQRLAKPPALPYDLLRQLNVVAATRQLEPVRWLVTNRLHAHVLAALLGIPHVVVDNSYGKIKSIFDDYSGRFSTAHWANSLSEARSLVSGVGVG